MERLELKAERLIVSILLLFFLLSGIYYALTNSVTSDEPTYIATGYINLHFNDYRFNIEHPPLVKQLAAIPLLFLKLHFPLDMYKASPIPMGIVNIQNALLFNMGNNLGLILLFSRIPNIIISMLLGVFIYLYSKKLNGSTAGIVSLALFVFSPSFLGHSALVTHDTTFSALYFMTIYFLMKFMETRRNLFLTLTGVFLGLSLTAKFSALILIPVIYILISIYALRFFKESEYSKLKNFIFILPLLPFASSYKSSFKFIAPALFVFIFFMIFYRKNAYSKKIKFICAILLIILTIAFTVVILDYTDFKWFPFNGATKAFFKGFSWFEGHARGGQEAYILGKTTTTGWWYYFPLAIIFKEPFAFLIIFLLGLISLFLKKEGILAKSLLFLPSLAYLFAGMFVNKVNLGIRLALPVYPFLFVIGGYSVLLARRFKLAAYALSFLLLILAADVLLAYPAHLSYFNRLIGGTSHGYKFLSDSNIAWGQDWKRMKQHVKDKGIKEICIDAGFYSDKSCDYYKIPYRSITNEEEVMPKEGVYVIETMVLASKRVKWADKIKPAAMVGGSLFVYNVTNKDVDLLKAE
jgi:4-amino-4-deoxy-L-arabinose transferase-like glycosyltransferase